ncbi:hypothetical protein V1J52_09555 [Streptomyces sp. TRM 70351]|uniref:hypothetical protein n=1 Tax=Streptomyces sp. TRM 70351 TaxID=3116552 RepID=UPI002E7C1DA3|nr:hypothetical protein [Streptomyces sp. TRM 70351]MEE1928434.1 hypothetical protein [Streptomyces sp. TRM 70351]
MDAHPRRWALAATALVLALTVPGCAGSTGAGGPTGPTRPATASPSAPAGRLSQERLRLALLSLADLPDGWAADSAEAARERGIGVPEPSGEPCRALFRVAAGARAHARFARTGTGPFLVVRTGSHPDADAAAHALAAFRGAARQCPAFQVAEGPAGAGGTAGYQAEPADPPRLGDDSAALRFVREPAGGSRVTVVADVLYVRIGPHTVHLAHAARDGDDGGGADGFAVLARRAVDKLREAASGRTPSPAESFPGATRL